MVCVTIDLVASLINNFVWHRYALYSFGAVVWKQNIGKGASGNPFATQVANFLEYCFLHLGWKAERGRAGMKEWKDPKYAPAAYYVVRNFNKVSCSI